VDVGIGRFGAPGMPVVTALRSAGTCDTASSLDFKVVDRRQSRFSTGCEGRRREGFGETPRRAIVQTPERFL
jgi:hypothetical protein